MLSLSPACLELGSC